MAISNPTWINYQNTIISGSTVMNANTGADACAPNAMSMGTAVATTLNGFATLADEDWEITFELGGRTPNGRAYLGLCSADVAFSDAVLNFVNWSHCLYITTETWSTGTPPHPANSVYIYEGSSTPKYWVDGIWLSNGQMIAIRNLGGVLRYHVGDRVIYRSLTSPVYPIEACVALACYDMEVKNQIITGPSVGVGTGEIAPGPSFGSGCSAPWIFPSPDALPQPPLANAPIPIRFQETVTDWREYSQRFANQVGVSNTRLTAPVRMFEIEWDGLSVEQAAMLDQHYDSTSGGIKFSMTVPHTDEVVLNCRYASYTRGPHTRYWSQSRQATIIQQAV